MRLKKSEGRFLFQYGGKTIRNRPREEWRSFVVTRIRPGLPLETSDSQVSSVTLSKRSRPALEIRQTISHAPRARLSVGRSSGHIRRSDQSQQNRPRRLVESRALIPENTSPVSLPVRMRILYSNCDFPIHSFRTTATGLAIRAVRALMDLVKNQFTPNEKGVASIGQGLGIWVAGRQEKLRTASGECQSPALPIIRGPGPLYLSARACCSWPHHRTRCLQQSAVEDPRERRRRTESRAAAASRRSSLFLGDANTCAIAPRGPQPVQQAHRTHNASSPIQAATQPASTYDRVVPAASVSGPAPPPSNAPCLRVDEMRTCGRYSFSSAQRSMASHSEARVSPTDDSPADAQRPSASILLEREIAAVTRRAGWRPTTRPATDRQTPGEATWRSVSRVSGETGPQDRKPCRRRP